MGEFGIVLRCAIFQIIPVVKAFVSWAFSMLGIPGARTLGNVHKERRVVETFPVKGVVGDNCVSVAERMRIDQNQSDHRIRHQGRRIAHSRPRVIRQIVVVGAAHVAETDGC